jgi:hypothetical protein
MKRYWINQPSVLQAYHDLHGRFVLAPEEINSPLVKVYFIDGPATSQEINTSALSDGWPFHLIKI